MKEVGGRVGEHLKDLKNKKNLRLGGENTENCKMGSRETLREKD